MSVTIIIGTQYGDEGKGKITDFFAEKAEAVVRYQGGNNAGHTVVVKEDVFKLNLLPSGVVQKKQSLIAPNVVIDVKVLLNEIDKIKEKLGLINLMIDSRCHVIMPYNIQLDELNERIKGKKKIGTTKRGIGPTYADKAARIGIRIEDLVDKKRLKEKLSVVFPLKKKIIESVFNEKINYSRNQLEKDFLAIGRKIKPFIGDVSLTIASMLKKEKHVLFEGAQGTFLDNTFGTYPFVTSSQPITGGALAGVGVGFKEIKNVIGLVKAYTTRVGAGYFITELKNEKADFLRTKGNEFGTTTGRARRVGWLDLVLINTAKRLNDLTEIALTKLDILSGLNELKICIGYKLGNKILTEIPAMTNELIKCKPVYKTFKGFKLTGKEKYYNELPLNAKKYVEFIEVFTGLPVRYIGVGAKRKDLIMR